MTKPATRSAVVSSDSEALILVDANDTPTGYLPKAACHDGDGVLHRAFSVFLFNEAGQLLIQKRAAEKRLWPGYWSNSCCSHPRRNETLAEATARRLEEELGVASNLEFLFKFQYHARFGDLGSEHELCSVFVGSCDRDPIVNRREISAWEWIDRTELSRRLNRDSDSFTPWFHLEWRRISADFSDQLPGT